MLVIVRTSFTRGARLGTRAGTCTAENEPLEVWGKNSIQYSLHSLLDLRDARVEVLLLLAIIRDEHVGNARKPQGGGG